MATASSNLESPVSHLPDAVVPSSRRLFVFLFLPVFTLCFYVVDHNFVASTKIEEVTGIRFDGSENRTADRTESINADSGSARLALAMFGLIGLCLPKSDSFRWSSPMFWSIAMYTAWIGTTLLWSVDPEFTFWKLVVVAVFIVAAFGIARQISLRDLGRGFALSCVTFILVGVFAELSLGTFLAAEDYRFTGTCHPNTQAAYGAIACLGAGLFAKNGKFFSFKALVIFGIGALCLFLTKSRTSLAAMLLGLIAMHGLRLRGQKRIVLVVSALTVLAIGILVVSLLGGQAQNRLGDTAAMGRSDDLTSLTGRVPLWEELLDTIEESPIIGHGYLAYWTPEQVEYLGDLLKWEIPHGHNMYLDVMMDGGIIGLSLFVLVFLMGILVAIRHYNATLDDGAAFTFGLLCFALVHGIGESFFKLYPASNFVLVTMLLRFAWKEKDQELSDSSPDLPEQTDAQLVGAMT